MLITPFWFGQRQLKAEASGEDCYRITGPNAPERFLGIRKTDDGRYVAFLRGQKEGGDEVVTGANFPTAYDAWEAAFELYRAREIV